MILIVKIIKLLLIKILMMLRLLNIRVLKKKILMYNNFFSIHNQRAAAAFKASSFKKTSI